MKILSLIERMGKGHMQVRSFTIDVENRENEDKQVKAVENIFANVLRDNNVNADEIDAAIEDGFWSNNSDTYEAYLIWS
jgi:uncharacterized protein (UPF0210 family)